MWNIMCSNRLVDQRIRKDNYRRHRLSLKKVKPLIDQTSPLEFQFLKTKQKPRQLARDLSYKIESQNIDLLRKMMNSQDEKQYVTHSNSFRDQDYTRTFRKLTEEMHKENRKMTRRLLETPSCIDFVQIEKRNQQMDRIKANISRAKHVVLSYGKRGDRIRPCSAR